MKLYNCFHILMMFLLVSHTRGDWFTSLGHLEDLLHSEKQLILALKEYIQAEEEKLSHINQIADDLQSLSNDALSDVDHHLGHPINQYRLIQRLVAEWPQVETFVTKDLTERFVAILSKLSESFPNEDDARGSAKAIMRLQDTYKLETHDIAEGMIKDSFANQSLTADDCFFIGRTAYFDKDYYHCALWMNEMLQKRGLDSFSKVHVLDYLSFCVAKQGDIQRAVKITSEILKISPSHKRAKRNYDYYTGLLKTSKPIKVPGKERLQRQTEHDHLPEAERYERLCRGENVNDQAQVTKNLKCRYWTNNNHPRLTLQPVKLEELWHSPQVVRFLDIISDEDIAEIKKIAKPELNRAEVTNPETGRGEKATYRVSKSAWLMDGESFAVGRLSRRASDLTGLSMDSAELLQIANYGIGGHYLPHHDHSTSNEVQDKFDKKDGNRIATFLAYLSDVEYGGSTVFIQPGIAARPIKGSAVFWYNLLPSGEGDARTLHAACPVLTGVKWVANKWIHERGNEFLRPCSLTPNADNKIF